jgi:hypothetical protein
VAYDPHQRRRIAERCWLIYDLIVRNFSPPQEFHLGFPDLAELALISGALQVRVQISPQGHSLLLLEEYSFRNHEMMVASYSYVLLDQTGQVLLRADSLPHHRVDHRGHRLTHFPHHLHNGRGRIHSFSGEIKDFVERAKVEALGQQRSDLGGEGGFP